MPPSVQAAGERYREQLDSVRGFVEECCTFSPDGWTPRPVLYKRYREWVDESGRLPAGVVSFNDRLRGAYDGQIEKYHGEGCGVGGGIMVKQE